MRNKVLCYVSHSLVRRQSYPFYAKCRRHVTPSSTRVLQMDRKKAREECVGTFNLISSDNELESKVCHGRDLPPNPNLFASLVFMVRISVSYLVRDVTKS